MIFIQTFSLEKPSTNITTETTTTTTSTSRNTISSFSTWEYDKYFHLASTTTSMNIITSTVPTTTTMNIVTITVQTTTTASEFFSLLHRDMLSNVL